MSKEYKLPQILKREIKKRKMTYEEFAMELNYATSPVANWARGAMKPRLESVMEIAEYFGLTLDQLVYGEGYNFDE